MDLIGLQESNRRLSTFLPFYLSHLPHPTYTQPLSRNITEMRFHIACALLLLSLGTVLGLTIDDPRWVSKSGLENAAGTPAAASTAMRPLRTSQPGYKEKRPKGYLKRRTGVSDEEFNRKFHEDDDYGKWAKDPNLGRGPGHSKMLRSTLYQHPSNSSHQPRISTFLTFRY